MIAHIKTPKAVNNPVVVNVPPVNISLFQIDTIASGSPATIPTNINIEIPFPIPLLVICSPSHINNAVPAINDITTTIPVIKLLSTKILYCL